MRWLALGDSITKDRDNVVTYVNTLANLVAGTPSLLAPFTSIVNNGATAFKTSDLLTFWAQNVAAVNDPVPSVITVMLGTNDHALTGGVPRVSLEDYATNLGTIISQLQALNHGTAFNGGHPKVIVMASPFVTDSAVVDQARLLTYVAAARAAALAGGAAFLDLNTPTGEAAGWSGATWSASFTDNQDGVHPNTAGHAVMTPLVRDLLVQSALETTMTTAQSLLTGAFSAVGVTPAISIRPQRRLAFELSLAGVEEGIGTFVLERSRNGGAGWEAANTYIGTAGTPLTGAVAAVTVTNVTSGPELYRWRSKAFDVTSDDVLWSLQAVQGRRLFDAQLRDGAIETPDGTVVLSIEDDGITTPKVTTDSLVIAALVVDSVVTTGTVTAGGAFIGASVIAPAASVLTLGANALAKFVVGADVAGISKVTSSNPITQLFGGSATGTDTAAGAFTIGANLSTGNATPGTLVLQVGAQVAGSGATVQTRSTALTFSHVTSGAHFASFAGRVGVAGASSSTNVALRIGTVGLVGTAQYGVYSDTAFGTEATTSGSTILAQLRTANSAFTMVTGRGIYVAGSAKGAASTITNLYGIYIEAQTEGGTINRSIFTAGGIAQFTGQTFLTGGTVATSLPVLAATQTWNDAGVTFKGITFVVTDTASAAGSLLAEFTVGAAPMFTVNKAGVVTAASLAGTGSRTVVADANGVLSAP